MENVSSIHFIADFFMLSISWCMILYSPIASSELTGNGLTKLLTNTAIGAMVISMIIGATDNINLWFVLKSVALLGLIFNSRQHGDVKTPLMWALYLFLCVLIPCILLIQYSMTLIPALFILSSSLLLGVITYSMILGHWYLVVPKLSEAPLKTAALITWLILFFKILWSGYTLSQNMDFFELHTSLGAGYAFNWTLLLMRMAFGYIVIVGMSYFNWKLLKLRSIQSSTGVLYAMTFFVFIGELVSVFLFNNYGLYI